MEKHFVKFYSPGPVIAENTTEEIDSWDVDGAVEMSKEITERYGVKPYGFMFMTRSRNDDELDSKVTNSSGMYYLGGEILTVEDLRKEAPVRNRIIIEKMECRCCEKVVRVTGFPSWCLPLEDGDVVLEGCV